MQKSCRASSRPPRIDTCDMGFRDRPRVVPVPSQPLQSYQGLRKESRSAVFKTAVASGAPGSHAPNASLDAHEDKPVEIADLETILKERDACGVSSRLRYC